MTVSVDQRLIAFFTSRSLPTVISDIVFDDLVSECRGEVKIIDHDNRSATGLSVEKFSFLRCCYIWLRKVVVCNL